MTEYSKMSFYERVRLRQSQMEDDRRQWDSQRQEIVEHYRPDLTVYSESQDSEQGQFLHEAISEGTGAWAAQVMARGFQSNMVGAHLHWIRHIMRQMRLRGNDRINAWLQRFDDYLREGVYQPSNFYEVIGQDVLDGITIGSPVMLLEENIAKRIIQCELPHYEQNYLMRDRLGNDIVYHRKFELSNLIAQKEFGYDNLPPSIQQQLREGNHKQKNKYLRVICGAGDPILHDFEDEPPVAPEKSNIRYRPIITRDWVDFYFCLNADSDVHYQGWLPHGAPGYFHKPFCTWHYFRNDHETYARTPAWWAIYDEKAGMSAWATMYDVAEESARRSMIALANMKGRIRMGPGRFTWAMDEREYNQPPKPILENINYPHGIDFVDRLDDKRKRHFHIDLFRMLDEYHKEHKQPPTAFEIAQMMAEKNAQVGPAIVSFDRGLLSPVDAVILEIEARSGRLLHETNPPDELMGMTIADMMPVFTGPLAQAQKIAVTMRRVQDPLSIVAPIFQIWPDSKYKIKSDVLVERVLEDLDFYQDAIASQEEYEGIMEMITRERAKQAALEQAAVMADIVPKLQGESKEGSPMKMVQGAA